MPENQNVKLREDNSELSNLNEYFNRELVRNLKELNTIISATREEIRRRWILNKH